MTARLLISVFSFGVFMFAAASVTLSVKFYLDGDSGSACIDLYAAKSLHIVKIRIFECSGSIYMQLNGRDPADLSRKTSGKTDGKDGGNGKKADIPAILGSLGIYDAGINISYSAFDPAATALAASAANLMLELISDILNIGGSIGKVNPVFSDKTFLYATGRISVKTGRAAAAAARFALSRRKNRV